MDEVLDPVHGMFVYSEDQRCRWINGLSFESKREFELIGILLGIAIYNGLILALDFPVSFAFVFEGGKKQFFCAYVCVRARNKLIFFCG